MGLLIIESRFDIIHLKVRPVFTYDTYFLVKLPNYRALDDNFLNI